MTKPTKRRRPGKRRPDFLRQNRFLLLLLAVAGLVVVGLVLFARLQEQPLAPRLPPVKEPPIDYTAKVHAEIETLLATLKVPPAAIQRDLDQQPARYTVEADFPSSTLIAGFRARIESIPGEYTVHLRKASSLTVEKSRQTEVIILFLPPAAEPPAGTLLSIIMDDLGRSTYTAERLIAMPEPVTFSVLPDEPHSAEVAELAYAAGREVMLHVPMEPQGYPAVNPGSDALFVKYSDAEIRRRFDRLLARIPHATGTNNHMGSSFTEDARALAPVMESLKEKGLFFIDSRTTGHSRVPEVAQQFGVPTMDRDVFLDNVAEVDAISREIRRLAGKADRAGMAIGICHPYPETLEALRRELPGLKDQGITVVPVSVLLRKQALAHGRGGG